MQSNETKFVAWLKDLSKESVPVVGGKGANLAEMFNAGFPIPPAFVVTAQCYKYFIEKTGIKDKIFSLLKDLDVEDTDKLQSVAKQIQQLIESTPVPEEIKEAIEGAYETICIPERTKDARHLVKPPECFVAVRSSATAEDRPEASFAGQQATFLNVRGSAGVVDAVRKCWASLFTARAIYYRTKNKFPHEKVLIAVVVQRMVQSEKSGVAFSINPATNNPNEIVIEAAFGLGEAVVSGRVTPDLYIVDKQTLKIKKIEIHEQKIKIVYDPEKKRNVEKALTPEEEKQQVLTDKEIVELARIVRKIEDHYGFAQDTEWAIEKGKIYIVQARPVTTFKPKEAEKPVEKATEGEIILKGETASAGVASGSVKVVLSMEDLDKVQKGDVLVTTMTTPDMVPAMQRAAAIITDEGGLTSHAAIVSREMGTPCIVGTENATKVLKDGEIITVDATHGVVYKGKIEVTKPQVQVAPVTAPAPKIITATQIKVICDLPEMAEKAAQTGADGVGLVRIEFAIVKGGVHPAQYIREGKKEEYINLLMDCLRGIAKAFKGKPVWVRTSDLRTDEYLNLKGAELEPKEANPMLGWHGIRRVMDEPEILEAEFEAIKRLHDEGYKNIGVMIPFVTRVREVRFAKNLLRKVGLEPCKDVEFGVMVETPASCFIIEDICKEGIDFISFGTNDLTQLTLGVDRNNEKLVRLFDELHPAVLKEIEMVVRTCQRYGVKTSICGQAGSRPEMAKFLVKLGIDSISVNIDAVQQIREVVARTEKQLLLELERKKIRS